MNNQLRERLGNQAGLAFTGSFIDGLPEFIGKDEKWNEYERLMSEFEGHDCGLDMGGEGHCQLHENV